jgi:membrane-associated phospholipid phosphatase
MAEVRLFYPLHQFQHSTPSHALHGAAYSEVNFRSLLHVLLAAGSVFSAATLAPCLGAQDSHGDSTRITRAWVTKADAVAGAFAVLATIAIAPLDARTARVLQEKRLQGSDDLQHTARDFAFLGGPGPFVIGAGLYAAGRLTRMPRLASGALHMTEAVLLAASITGLGKGFSGRALPSVNDSNPENFQFGRGFHDRNGPFVSFPSGHAAASFAMAAALTSEAELWHPGLARIVGPIAYGSAGFVGLARMYQNDHWASDLPLAVAIGTWSGLTVVARAHPKYAKRSDTRTDDPGFLLEMLRSTTVVPVAGGGHGAGLAWSIPLELGSRPHVQ